MAFFYVFFMIPETRGISLEEVDELYRSKIPAWRSVSWKPAERHHHHVEGKMSDEEHQEHARAAAVFTHH